MLPYWRTLYCVSYSLLSSDTFYVYHLYGLYCFSLKRYPKLFIDIISYYLFPGGIKMLRKIILPTIVLMGLTTTGMMAEANGYLVELAAKQETLSCNINKAYKKQNSDAYHAIIRKFKLGQKTLETRINNPEICNLLVYMSLCIKELEEVVQKPYTSKNAQKVADLSASLSEGNHYIVALL